MSKQWIAEGGVRLEWEDEGCMSGGGRLDAWMEV